MMAIQKPSKDHGRITAGSRQDHGRITAGSRQDHGRIAYPI